RYSPVDRVALPVHRRFYHGPSSGVKILQWHGQPVGGRTLRPDPSNVKDSELTSVTPAYVYHRVSHGLLATPGDERLTTSVTALQTRHRAHSEGTERTRELSLRFLRALGVSVVGPSSVRLL